MKHFFFPSPFFSVQFEQEDFEKFHFSWNIARRLSEYDTQ